MILYEAYRIIKTKPELSSKAVIVYLNLVSRANWDSNACFPGLKTIAADCRISMSSVQRALNELLSTGLIKKFNRHRADGGYSSNLYVLMIDIADQLAAKKKYLQQQARKLKEKRQKQIRMDEYIAAKGKVMNSTFFYNLLKVFNFKHLTNGYSQ